MFDSGGGKSHSTDISRKVCFFTGYFVIYLKNTAPVVQYEIVNWSKLEIRDKGKEAN